MDLMLLTYLCGDVGQMPVGPLMLAQLARQRGWRVQVEDLPLLAEEERFLHRLTGCDVVGFSTISSTFHRSLRLASRLKEIAPRLTVVMGGPQATATAARLLDYSAAVDMIFPGEAEEGWAAFVAGQPLSEIPGVCFRRQGRVAANPPGALPMDLDLLPVPAFDLYTPSRLGLAVPVETGRGCPFRCTYCSTNRYFSRRFRAKSPGRILAEMDLLHQLYQVWSFDLIQDNFNTDQKKILAFCDAIQAHSRRYAWNISARPDKVDEWLTSRLRESGCVGIYFGLETGSERMQKVVRKNLKLERAVDNISRANQAGFATTVSFIVGFPGEEVGDLRQTLALYVRLSTQRNHLTQLHLLSPLNGSHLLEEGGASLAFDGMPTDFNENEEGWREGEVALFRDHPGLFPHMHYFADTQVSRERYLFIVYLVRLGWSFFHNVMTQACRVQGERLVDFLLTAPVPPEMVTDANFPRPHREWIERGADVLEDFIGGVDGDLWYWQELLNFDRAYALAALVPDLPPHRVHLPRALADRRINRVLPELTIPWDDPVPFQVSRSAAGQVEVVVEMADGALEERLRQLCAPCGECCLDEQGFHCSYEEWQAIVQFLQAHHQPVPRAAPVAWQGMALAGSTRFLAKTVAGARSLHDDHDQARRAAGEGGWVRTACGHLTLEGHGLVCGIQEIKPAECLSFPFTLVADAQRPEGWVLEEAGISFAWRGRCALAHALSVEPALRRHYGPWVARRGQEASAAALGRWNVQDEENSVA